MKKITWLSWERHVRNRSLCDRLGAELFELDIAGAKWKRYLTSITTTARILWRNRHNIIVTQNPSLVLSLQATLLKPLLGYTLIVDAHNAGIYPNEGNSPLLSALANFIIRRANAVIVTNNALAERVASINGNPIILPDPLPHFAELAAPTDSPVLQQIARNTAPSVLFVCTWAKDEPYTEVFSAAEQTPEAIYYVTGNSKGRAKEYGKPLPSNVVLTGFVPEDTYHQLLLKCDIILDLTTRENCLVCGAYEAVAVKTPFILSNTEVLRTYFRLGGEHVNNSATDIANAVKKIISNQTRYNDEVASFNNTLENEWNIYFTNAKKVINNEAK